MKPTGENEPRRWQKLGARLLTHTRIFDLQSVDFQHPEQAAPRDFFVLHPPDWVNVLALTPAHELVLVRQFRFGLNDFSLEIPGGLVDPGEDPLAAGVRELEEETGLTGKSARMLASIHPNPAMQDNRCHFVFVNGAVRTTALAWDENEEIQISQLPVEEVYALAATGKITHSLVLAALLLFRPVWESIRNGQPV